MIDNDYEIQDDAVEKYLRPFIVAMCEKDRSIDELKVEVANLQHVDKIKTDDQHRLLTQLARMRNDLSIANNERDYLRDVVSKFEASMVPLNGIIARRNSFTPMQQPQQRRKAAVNE